MTNKKHLIIWPKHNKHFFSNQHFAKKTFQQFAINQDPKMYFFFFLKTIIGFLQDTDTYPVNNAYLAGNCAYKCQKSSIKKVA